jgi:hypothetical protein
LDQGKKPPHFEMAGPRKTIYFDPSKLKCGIVTCGGLCPGLNDVIRAIVLGLYHHYGVKTVFGFPFGYAGLTYRHWHKPLELTPKMVEDIHIQGRLKLLFFLVLAFILLSPISPAKAGPSTSENIETNSIDQFMEKLKKGKKGKNGTHYYWDSGFHIDSPTGKFKVRFNALLNLDVGKINADNELGATFPDLEGSHTDLRRLRLEVWSWPLL